MPAAAPALVSAPEDGIWRVGRGDDPLAPRRPLPHTLLSTKTGNRFDSSDDKYAILYFSSTLEGCFGETLARFRPSLTVMAEIADEWRKLGFMEVGAVPREWRQRRTCVKVSVPDGVQFLDLENRATLEFLRHDLALGLSSLGHQDLDISTIRGPDRRVTRLIGSWAYLATDESGMGLGGIRYFSRIDSEWELWAVFDDVPIKPLETRPVLLEMQEMKTVAAGFGLTVH